MGRCRDKIAAGAQMRHAISHLQRLRHHSVLLCHLPRDEKYDMMILFVVLI